MAFSKSLHSRTYNLHIGFLYRQQLLSKLNTTAVLSGVDEISAKIDNNLSVHEKKNISVSRWKLERISTCAALISNQFIKSVFCISG